VLDPVAKKKMIARLKRIEGQLAAVRRMVEEDTYCVDVLMQVAAARGALGKAGQVMLDQHLHTCVRVAFEAEDAQARKDKLDELVQVFARFGGLGSRC
jgi:CsoR family transcriptional regulator, copper-sensing transcriptional repressor